MSFSSLFVFGFHLQLSNDVVSVASSQASASISNDAVTVASAHATVPISNDAVSVASSQAPVSTSAKVVSSPAVNYVTLGSFSWDQDYEKLKVNRSVGLAC